jgi:hypothetical protein
MFGIPDCPDGHIAQQYHWKPCGQHAVDTVVNANAHHADVGSVAGIHIMQYSINKEMRLGL